MCMTVKEMNKAMEQIQEWKRIKEEAEDNITALNAKVIEFLNETEECETVDKKGNPIRKFIGNLLKGRGRRWTKQKSGRCFRTKITRR